MAADLEKLIDLAYSAAVDDEQWRTWTEELVDEFGSPGALFYLIDPERSEMCRSHIFFRDRDNDLIRLEYDGGAIADDPQMDRVCSAKQSEIYRDVDHVDIENARTREYLAWQEARCGTRHHITASVVLPDGLEAGVSLHFTAAQGVPGERVRQQMNALFPHFARALRLGHRHAESVQQSWWDGLARDQWKPLVLLGDVGTVLRLTPAAEKIFGQNDGITVRGRRLRCDDPASQQALDAAIARACAPAAVGASGVLVRSQQRAQPYSVSVYPLVHRRRFLVAYGAAALVVVDEPSTAGRALPPHCKEMLELTRREGEVADMLLAGHSLASLAAALNISENTARGYLKSLFARTRTSRQAELLSFLARLG